MTTARKPRSSTAARKTTVATETSDATKTATAKSPKKSPKTTTKKSTATRTRVHETPLHGSTAGEIAATDTTTTNETGAALQGGAAPGARTASPDVLHRMIAEAAYYRAERRGFAPGGEEMDWFQAEAEVRGRGRTTR